MKDKPQTGEDDDYNPYTSRNLPKGTNNFESMIHIIKAILGTGILAMPEAFKNSGLILGFVASLGNCFLCTYAIHVLVNCFHILCKREKVPVLSYSEAMAVGFRHGPPWAQKRTVLITNITDGFIIVYQLGVCCVYTLFVVVNIKLIVDVYLKEKLSLHAYLLMVLVPLFFINCWRSLKILVPFSAFSSLISVVVIGTIFYFIFATPLPNIAELAMVKVKTFPLAFGTTCFSFTSVPVTIAVENNMKYPQDFGGWFGVYNRAIAMLFLITISVAFFGFWKFSEDTEPSIILNFPEDSVITQSVTVLYSLAIYISFALNAFVPIRVILDVYLFPVLKESKRLLSWEYLLRVAVVTMSVFFAATLPMLGLFMSLFGAITISHMALVFPGILDFCTRYPDNYGPCKIYKYRDIFLIVYGYIGLITGLVIGLIAVVKEYQTMYGKS